MSITYARRTIKLLELVRELHTDQRPATPEEHELLSSWMGWGPCAKAFDETADEKWQAIGRDLMLSLGELCGKQGIEEAKRAITNSYFTDPVLTRAIWRILTGLGFSGGRALELGCGTGLFLSSAPSGIALRAVGVERDPFTAMVARLRMPQTEIIQDLLQQVAIPRRRFDIGIGNPPFGQIHIEDEENREARLSIHNYFLLRYLRAVRLGGIVTLVTSRYLLDAEEDWQRKYVEQYGDFLGAIRLPQGAHKAAHTDVITDILVFQRRAEEDTQPASKPWHHLSGDVLSGIEVNEYFATHPQRILGEVSVGRGMYRKNEMVVKRLPDFEEALDRAVDDFLAEMAQDGRRYQPPKDLVTVDATLVTRRADSRIEGSFYLEEDDKPIQIVNGEAKPVSLYREEITHLIHIRDAALALLNAEEDLDAPDEALEPLREELNEAYDTYVKRFRAMLRSKLIENQKDEDGEPITRREVSKALRAFQKDFHYATLLGLVEYNDVTHEEKKADIFFKRIKRRPVVRTSATDISEAVAICMDQHGTLKVDILAALLSTDPGNIPTRLGDMAYEDPLQKDTWIPANLYLSGNVRIKLKQARQAVELQGPRFQRNVDALEPIIPVDIPPEQIHAELGVTWVDPMDITQFVYDLTQMVVKVVYEPISATWSIHTAKGAWFPPATTSTWGTERMNAITLIEKCLNKTFAVVYDRTRGGDLIKNEDETIAAQDKQREICEKFTSWIWQDLERTTRLAARYNEIFHSEVPTKYDGSFLTFPGMNPAWAAKMHPWQKSFVARMLTNRSALCVHPVGAGKTLSMIACGMKLRQLGMINRAGIVVPNHLLAQITSEAKRLYPDARVLMIGPDDLKKENRAVFAARVAFGDYDLVVMTHGALYRLGMHPESEYDYLEERINLFEQMLTEQMKEEEKSRAKTRTLKGIQNRILTMQEKQRALLRKKVEGVTFEQIGLTCLFVDECQFFKNLGLPANTDGFTVRASQRAMDMEMKLRYLERNNGGQPFAAFFSATPWANNLVEAYVMMYYLCYDRLKKYGLDSVDAFIANFVDISTQVEISPDGKTFQQKTRARGFFNFLDLMDILNQVADIQPPEILDSKRPKLVKIPIPIEPTPEIVEEVRHLVARAEDIHNGMHANYEGKEDNMLRVVTRGRQLAVSPRLCNVAGRSVKVEAVVEKVFSIWQRCQQNTIKMPGEHQSLQILFCDMGCPSPDKGDQVYGEIKRGLVARGMPIKAIRYIHEAKNDTEKADLFRQCRSGEVAVLIGSTEKLGTGTNVQDRCVAIHMIAPPWRPDMIAQCVGRAHRPGNWYATVYEYNYVVTGTFDAYMWQTLERKAHFMAQLLSGNVTDREMDVQSEMELSYAEVKAAATGDELILEQASIDMEVARLQRLARVHVQARDREKQAARYARQSMLALRQRAEACRKLTEKVAACPKPGFYTWKGEQIKERQQIGLWIMQQVYSLLMEGKAGSRFIATWSGVRLSVRVEEAGRSFTAEMILESGYGADASSSTILIQPAWMRGGTKDGEEGAEQSELLPPEEQDEYAGPQQWRIAAALEKFFENAQSSIARFLEDAERAEQAAATYEAQAQVPFAQEAAFRKLMARKMAIDAYTEQVAAGKLSAEELERERQVLLADTDRDHARSLTIEAQAEVQEVFALTRAAQEALGVATVPLVVEVGDLSDTKDPLPAIKPVSVSVSAPKPAEIRHASIEELTKVAAEQIEKLDLDQLVAVSLFDDIAPKAATSLQKKGGTRKKKAAPAEKQLAAW